MSSWVLENFENLIGTFELFISITRVNMSVFCFSSAYRSFLAEDAYSRIAYTPINNSIEKRALCTGRANKETACLKGPTCRPPPSSATAVPGGRVTRGREVNGTPVG